MMKKYIKDLTDKLNEYAHAYYTKNISLVDDAVYDKLYHELRELELQYPKYKRLDSPTNRVGDKTSSLFQPVTREQAMLSLDNLFFKGDYSGLDTWLNTITDKLGSLPEFLLEPKYDGLAISLEYKDGILFRASTRGDGKVGEDVTDNVRKLVKNLPTEISDKQVTEVRGELIITDTDFTMINSLRDTPFTNPRNGASGSIRSKTLETNVKHLTFMPYEVIGKPTTKLSDRFDNVVSLMNKPVIATSRQDIIQYYENIVNNRNTLGFPVDGIVIKVNDSSLHDSLGYTSKSPNWAIAFKLPAMAATSVVLDIQWQTGRTGLITPVAVIEPVNVAGVTVSNVTLHNFSEMRRLNIAVEDTVEIIRSGDVIPKITQVLVKGKQLPTYPKSCPSCGSPAVFVGIPTDLYTQLSCSNKRNCSGVLLRKLEYAVSRPCLDIDGLSTQRLSTLIEKGLLKQTSDIYKLTIDDLSVFGDTMAEKLYANIQASRRIEFNKFITTLALPNVGTGTANRLVEEYTDLDDLLTTTVDRLMKVDTIGAETAPLIVHYMNLKSNLNGIRELAKEMIITYPSKLSIKLKDKSFVITGTFSIKREEIKKLILAHSGTVSSNVSANTDYVIAGDNAGSKLSKAVVLNKPVIGLDDLYKSIN